MKAQSRDLVWLVDVHPNLLSPLQAPRCFTSDEAAKKCRDEYAEDLARRVNGMVRKVGGTLNLEVVSGTAAKAYVFYTVTIRFFELEGS